MRISKFDVIRFLSTDTQIAEEEFVNTREAELVERLFVEVQESYHRKWEAIIKKAFPILKQIHTDRGETINTCTVSIHRWKKSNSGDRKSGEGHHERG